MAAYKVNVSLPEELVTEIDAAAAEMGTTRSAFIAEASTRYIVEREMAEAQDQRKRDIDGAIASMREVGERIPRDFDYVEFIRKSREERRIW